MSVSWVSGEARVEILESIALNFVESVFMQVAWTQFDNILFFIGYALNAHEIDHANENAEYGI